MDAAVASYARLVNRILEDLVQRYEVQAEEVFNLEVSFEEGKRTFFLDSSKRLEHTGLTYLRLILGPEPLDESVVKSSLALRENISQFGLVLREAVSEAKVGCNIGISFANHKASALGSLEVIRASCGKLRSDLTGALREASGESDR